MALQIRVVDKKKNYIVQTWVPQGENSCEICTWAGKPNRYLWQRLLCTSDRITSSREAEWQQYSQQHHALSSVLSFSFLQPSHRAQEQSPCARESQKEKGTALKRVITICFLHHLSHFPLQKQLDERLSIGAQSHSFSKFLQIRWRQDLAAHLDFADFLIFY